MSLRVSAGIVALVAVVVAGPRCAFGTPHEAARGNLVSFPGMLGQLPSLDGRAVLVNVVSKTAEEARAAGGSHALFVTLISEHPPSSVTTRILPYARYVAAQWSPDSRHLLVNDYYYEGRSTCLIFSITDLHRSTDLEKAMRAHLQGTSEGLENRDLLVEALGWIDADSLVVSVTRTASVHPAETTRLFEYSLRHGFRELRPGPWSGEHVGGY